SMNVYYADVWTDATAAGRAPDASFNYSYNDALQFKTPAPTKTACLDSPTGPSAWHSNCRIVINYPTHIQALWDLKRQTLDAMAAVVTAHPCPQGGCHPPPPAPTATDTVQLPAGQLDLTATASND